MAGYSGNRTTHQHRLNRIEGQIRGIARMVDEDRYCLDILIQVAAVSRALQSFALELLDDHLTTAWRVRSGGPASVTGG